MPPLFATPRRIAIYFGAWLALGLFRAVLLVHQPGFPWTIALAISVPLLLFYGCVCAASWYICRAQPLRAGHITDSLSVQALAALAAAALWVGVAVAWSGALASSIPPPDVRASLFLSGVMLYLLVAAGHYVHIAAEESRAAERNALHQAVLAREAELRALRAQINPHFIFNSLHSISALTTVDPQGARLMCLRLGDFLRHGLKHGAMEEIPLDGELEMIEQYLGIEQIRFGPRLTVRREYEDETKACSVPPLLLQPLVENAIKHGIATLIDGGTLTIRTKREGERLQLAIENPYDGDSRQRKGSGVGLSNVRARLRMRYGRDGMVSVHNINGQFRVTLELPWKGPQEV
ncbi:MAG: sensor histidine kinase [Luteitalea sp.]|nr:sensor histidine kinase [Luteitalea sp.]